MLMVSITAISVSCAAGPRYLTSPPRQGTKLTSNRRSFRISRFPSRRHIRSFHETDSDSHDDPVHVGTQEHSESVGRLLAAAERDGGLGERDRGRGPAHAPPNVEPDSLRRLVWSPRGWPHEIAWAEIDGGPAGRIVEPRGHDKAKGEDKSTRKEYDDEYGVKDAKTGRDAHDCSFLPQIYADMGGPAWTNGQEWTSTAGAVTDGGCCGWYGVTCSNTSRVISLELGYNGLAGALSDSIFKLGRLRVLSVSDEAVARRAS